ncbi:MAG: ABC transporter ATP-binding protein [bacterium]
MNAIEIQSVKKSYGSTQALAGVDLSIRQGEFFGLLGPNGAGKTTLIHSLVGLVKPQGGSITVMGDVVAPDSIASKRHIGFAPQEVNVDRFFNLRKTLEFQAGFYGFPRSFAKERAQEMLEQFRLVEKAKFPFYKLSGGMQKRLLIARALMSQPKILILDEPSAGIDVEQRRDLWEYLRDLNRDGTTILLTTHYIDEAEALCERVAIINYGRIIEIGKPKELIEKYCEQRVEIQLSEPMKAQYLEGLSGVEAKENLVIGRGQRIGSLTGEILERTVKAGGNKVLDIQVKHGSLEDVFVQLTGQPMSADERKGNGKGAPEDTEKLPAEPS